jgi:GTP pyrophosphokinase
MVKVRDTFDPSLLAGDEPAQWLETLQLERKPEATELILKTLTLARDIKTDKEALRDAAIHQGLDMAGILAGLGMDTTTLATACIYPLVRDELIGLNKVRDSLGNQVHKLLSGVRTMAAVRDLQNANHSSDKVAMDPIRHMLLAMVDDTRVVLVKLAEQVSLLHAAKDLPDDEKLDLALETRDIYAPLANRLGIGQLKWELEDFSFRFLEPVKYKQIAKSLAERRVDRDEYIKKVIETLDIELKKLNIKAEVVGRAKHIYSIWRKMQRKNVSFEEIYDARAVRILVDEIPACYGALGVVHSLWPHIAKEFDDYVATPKENGYQSIHTAVIGPQGKALEVQIRTHQMHHDSEHGVAAHWRYKEDGKSAGGGHEQKIAWLRELLEWQEELADSDELLNEFREQVVEDRVYVFTPQGEIIDIPPKGTPLDFAYRIHTDVGNRCKGAKVNGRIVPLTYELNTGEQVEILTAKNGAPSRDWMNPAMGYLKSSRARAKIHQYFKRQDRDKNILAGKPILDKELQRHGLKQVDLHDLAKAYNYHHVDDLYAGVGAGDLRLQQVVNSARLQLHPEQADEPKPKKQYKPKKQPKVQSEIVVQGVNNLLTTIAKCCKPVPGDQIVGYVSQSRGVVIHRIDCSHIIKAYNTNYERIIEADWGTSQEFYTVDLHIRAYDRQGLLRDITAILANNNIGVVTLNTNSKNISEMKVDIYLQVEVPSADKLAETMTVLNRIPNISDVERM